MGRSSSLVSQVPRRGLTPLVPFFVDDVAEFLDATIGEVVCHGIAMVIMCGGGFQGGPRRAA